MSKVMIGVPCFSDPAVEVFEDWLRFFFHLGRRMPQHEFFTSIVSKKEQFRARNSIVEQAQVLGADYLLMLDDDMVINPHVTQGQNEQYGFIQRLIDHDKDVIGALYYQRQGNCRPVLMRANDGGGYRFLDHSEVTHGLQRVDVAGGGCLLVKMRVFDFIPQPYFSPEHDFGTDIQLCRAAAAKGFEVWADTSIVLGHLRQERVIVHDKNRDQFAGDLVPGEVRSKFTASAEYSSLFEDARLYTGCNTLEEMWAAGSSFLDQRPKFEGSDFEWYRKYPRERVARQVAFNHFPHKREMTEYIIGATIAAGPREVLDYGCGIGIPSFVLAKTGNRVTSLDIQGTGTFEFLKHRVKKHRLDVTFYESLGFLPHFGDKTFDVIVVMDCLEHLTNWRQVLSLLVRHLHPNGALFCNNGILDDKTHPEHYDLSPEDFLIACAREGLAQFSPIGFTHIESAKGAA